MAAGGHQHVLAIALQARHVQSKISAFDVSSELYEAVDSGALQFGIDHQAYLQGYLPVALLMYALSSRQVMINTVIETGPAFVESSPSESQVTCEEKFFVACPREMEDVAASSSNSNTCLIVGLSVVAAFFVLSVGILAYRMHKLNKHVEELEAKGRSVRRLSLSQRLSSTFKDVSAVVEAEDVEDEGEEKEV